MRVVLFKSDRYKNMNKMQEVEVRVGNSKVHAFQGLKRITANRWCGKSSDSNVTTVETVDCHYTLAGQFMSLQSHATSTLDIGEVNIYSGLEPGKPRDLVLLLCEYGCQLLMGTTKRNS